MTNLWLEKFEAITGKKNHQQTRIQSTKSSLGAALQATEMAT
jgi:hypothetical protein